MTLKNLIATLAVGVSVATAQPWEPQIIWERNGAGDHSRYGGTVFPLGDQNNDGFMDWGIEAWGWGPFGQPSEQLIEFFHGGNPIPNQPYRTFHANPDSSSCIYVWPLGDLNGDGFVDYARNRCLVSSPGWIEFFFGGPESDTLADVLYQPQGPESGGPIGDLNGDGFDDIFAYDWDLDYTRVYFGGSPIDTVADWTLHSAPDMPQQALVLSYGDLNHDGFSDFVTGNLNQNLIFVYYGSTEPDTMPRVTLTGIDPGTMAIVDDVNGDERADLAVLWQGIEIHFGADTISADWDYSLNIVPFCGPEDIMGIGDVNGDSFGDFATVSQICGNSDWGNAALYLGHQWLNPNPVASINGRAAPYDLIGIKSCAGLGDVNGDGVNDFIVGAFNGDFDGWRGRALILSGDTSIHVAADDPRPEMPNELSLDVYPNPFNAQSRVTFSIPRAAKVNIDLYNLAGQRVMKVLNGNYAPGEHAVTLNGEGLASGIYFMRVEAGEMRAVKKVVVMK